MIVLSTCAGEPALKGAFGVLVGLAVFVGGTSENGVLVKNGVNVGRGVSLGVNCNVGLAVHVGCNWKGVAVGVGVFGPSPPGGKILKGELGVIKIYTKYTAMQAVMNSTRRESMSHICMGLL